MTDMRLDTRIDTVWTHTARIHTRHATDFISPRKRAIPDLRLWTANRVLAFETFRAMDRQAIDLPHRLDHGPRRRNIFHEMAHRVFNVHRQDRNIQHQRPAHDPTPPL